MNPSVDVDPRLAERAALYRQSNAAFAHWAAGYGVIAHDDATQVRVREMTELLHVRGKVERPDDAYAILAAADRVACAAMWLVVHSTYARNVFLDGRDLDAGDFKATPEGHTGGSLNMVPAYVGYLAADALAGLTRSWIMGQGHCVAAIDSANVVTGNMTPAHAARYGLSDEALTRFVRDFYSYELGPDGRPGSPRGSHVNAHTAGGVLEGGYLGFAELQYVHMPLPGERLVAFLSDGAFEEQRGSDWAPRWWRAADSGLVAPIMIENGRRIDQRSTIAQLGGAEWLRQHLRLNHFDPIEIDGRDPAAFAWVIHEMEERLAACADAVAAGRARYPVRLPYAIAAAPKGYGFPGAGTNRAHNLPLEGNPAVDEQARQEFNRGARALWVPPAELIAAAARLDNHAATERPRERDHALAARVVPLPRPAELAPLPSEPSSPMAALDQHFVALVRQNPQLRPRVGNPDELRSNGMNRTLDALKHRVTSTEPGLAEAIDGAVITALNEEAVVCAALGNKGGLNLVVTYEAFAPKMLGAVRQELIFARHQREAGREPGWLSVALVLTSHTWENGKNEQSHQDPTMAEALLQEMADGSRVVFVVDGATARAALAAAYATRGQIWTLVVPKRQLPPRCDDAQARAWVADGGARLRRDAGEKIVLVAVGAYQLVEVLRASERLTQQGIAHGVSCLVEPGRFRAARDAREAAALAPADLRAALLPAELPTVVLTHTRPEPLLGLLAGARRSTAGMRVLGYANHGGTLDADGMLRANGATADDVVAAAQDLLLRR
jgi:phosphoketolase